MFSNLESGFQAVASYFELKYGDSDEDNIEWKILAQKEQITVCPMENEQASKEGMNPSDKSPFWMIFHGIKIQTMSITIQSCLRNSIHL